MNEPLWILGVLFGFAILVQLFSLIWRSLQLVNTLNKEVNASAQIILDCTRKNEWLEARLEDLLDASQLQSCDANHDPDRLNKLIRNIKNEAAQKGYLLVLAEIDESD